MMDEGMEISRHLENNMGNMDNAIYIRDSIDYGQSESVHDNNAGSGTITLSTDGSSSGNIYVTYPNVNLLNVPSYPS